MKFTNKHNLPDAFVRVVQNDYYDNGGADFSPSSLSLPPRAWALMKTKPDEVVVDVSSKVASIIGQGTHLITERAARPGDICEKRFFSKITVGEKTYIVSAQIDLYEHDSKVISDWKTTKAYAFSKKAGGGAKPEWIAQMNIQAWLMRKAGHEVNGLKIIALLKDWKEGDPSHPPTEVVAVDIDMWPDGKVIGYITSKIEAFEQALVELPKCKSGDSWSGRRCAKWCDASSACEQYKQAKQTGIIGE